jgi:hypothetical protein
MKEYNEASLADEEKVIVVGMADVFVHNSTCTPVHPSTFENALQFICLPISLAASSAGLNLCNKLKSGAS